MKALIYAVLAVIVAGMAMYVEYQKRQIYKKIDELSKEWEDNGETD